MIVEWSDTVAGAFERHTYVARVSGGGGRPVPSGTVVVYLHLGAARYPTADWEELVLKLGFAARRRRLREIRMTSPPYAAPPA